jgi:hypothetical protein
LKPASAAAIYFLAVFSAGFLLGSIRVLLLKPGIGAVAATLCEAPLLLIVMVVAARWAPRLAGMTTSLARMLTVGMGALVLQQAADLLVGTLLRGLSAQQQLARLATPEGAIYAALLALFALMPRAGQPNRPMMRALAAPRQRDGLNRSRMLPRIPLGRNMMKVTSSTP